MENSHRSSSLNTKPNIAVERVASQAGGAFLFRVHHLKRCAAERGFAHGL